MSSNTDRNRTDKDFTDFSKLSKDELNDIADDLYERSKYPEPRVTPELLTHYLDDSKVNKDSGSSKSKSAQ